MIPNPWVILGAVVVFVASVTGAFFYGDHVGSATSKAAYEGQQIAELKKANAEIDRLNKAARAQESSQAAALALQGADYEKKLQDAEDQRRTDVAAARAGRLIVRVPGKCSGGSPAPEAATPAPRSDGPAGCELSAAAGGNLLDLIADADRNTRQLTACQTVIETYMKGSP